MTSSNGSALPNIDPVKTQLDLAWAKIHDSLHREAEGNNLWIEGALELITILHDARQRYDFDQAFSAWLTEHGYGEDRLTRHDRQALINMGIDLDVTREVLHQTERRSWRLIWEEEVKPRLPSGGQPAEDQQAEAAPTNNTSRPKKVKAKKPPKPEWSQALDAFFSDCLTIANDAIAKKNNILDCTPAKKTELLEKVTEKWLEKIGQGSEALEWIHAWANGELEAEAEALIGKGSRVKTTAARASGPMQPEA
jgi:hypothetical protein